MHSCNTADKPENVKKKANKKQEDPNKSFWSASSLTMKKESLFYALKEVGYME